MKNILVGNLSFGATEDTVRSLFEQFGTVDRVSIITDRDTRQSRGFGFVGMSNSDEASGLPPLSTEKSLTEEHSTSMRPAPGRTAASAAGHPVAVTAANAEPTAGK